MRKLLSVLALAGLLAALITVAPVLSVPVLACGSFTQQNYHDDPVFDFDNDDSATDINLTYNGWSGTIEQDMYLFSDGCNNHYYRTSMWEEGFSGHRFTITMEFYVSVETPCGTYNYSSYTVNSYSSYMYTPTYYQAPFGLSGCGLGGGPGPHATSYAAFILAGTHYYPGVEENEGDGSPT